ncbi:GNAT family N-acetyltransferase [Allokutzneria albata]|uniref:Acetyltransferase (GNAT) family protein n=1 Tax=Allokutzneria albata TaxID=211114 RepID=A0A1H0BBU2_ALLAB|nr:GNAT family N-acetyltransferase [Allokutzneria albata]SDN43085.1 Acetyltransferase (GNAT) family protein [Allokutzneria albata]
MNVRPLDESTWPLLEELFGPRGAVEGCWCMWFRQSNAEQRANAGEGNRKALRDLVRSGAPVGLLAVQEERAVGWVAVAPRLDHSRLERSQVAKPVDLQEDLAGVWSVTCFFVHRSARRQGVTAALLDAAVEHARDGGARIVEGYPVDTEGAKRNSGSLYHGTLNLFRANGFEVVQRRGTRRALVRRVLR